MEDSLSSPSRAPSPGFVTHLLDRSIGKLWNERPAADAPIAEYEAWGRIYCTAVDDAATAGAHQASVDEYADEAWRVLGRFLPPSSGAWPEWARGALEDAAVRAEDAQQGEAALTTLSIIAARTREQTSSPRTPRRSRPVPYVAVPSRGHKRPREIDSDADEDREASPEAPLPSSSIPGTPPASPRVHKRPAPTLPKRVTLTLPPAPTVKPKKPKQKKKAGGISAADDDAPQILEGFEQIARCAGCTPMEKLCILAQGRHCTNCRTGHRKCLALSGEQFAEWWDERGYPRAIIVEVDGKIVSVDMPKPDPVYFNARLRGITSRLSLAPERRVGPSQPGDRLRDWGLPADIDPRYAGTIIALLEELAVLRLRRVRLSNTIEDSELLLIHQLRAAGFEGKITGLVDGELSAYDEE
ncbi:hypothetical protein VTO73DRAFT_10762 [Trametes versicolor]